jgi:simple sugar transport system permease protein
VALTLAARPAPSLAMSLLSPVVALAATLVAGGLLLAGVAGGMAWGAIPAFLRTRFRANEILVSLMLAYVAALLLDWAVRGPWRDPMGFGFPQSRDFGEAFLMPGILEGTRLHAGLFLAIAAAAILAVVMGRTIRGFSLRVIGAAPRAGAFAGFSAPGAIWFSLLLSGGLAGLAGAVEVTATIGQLQPDISAGYGFTAIIVAFLGRLNPLGALFGAVVLAVSFIGGENAQILLQLPRNVTFVFQGMLLFFLLAADTLIRYRIVMARRTAA